MSAEVERRLLKQSSDEFVHQPWQRSFLGYRGRFVDDCIINLPNGKPVRLAQAPSANVSKTSNKISLDKNSDPALTGTTVWDGALLLSLYLTSTGILDQLPGKHGSCANLPTAIELGSGTGAVSLCLAASALVGSVTITDIPDVVPHIQRNVTLNKSILKTNAVFVRPLRWGNEEDLANLSPVKPPYDIVLGSDLIYYSDSPTTPHTRQLFWTLERIVGPNTVVYLCSSLQHNPNEVVRFLKMSEEGGFDIQVVDNEALPQELQVSDMLIVRMTRVSKAAIDAGVYNSEDLQQIVV